MIRILNNLHFILLISEIEVEPEPEPESLEFVILLNTKSTCGMNFNVSNFF